MRAGAGRAGATFGLRGIVAGVAAVSLECIVPRTGAVGAGGSGATTAGVSGVALLLAANASAAALLMGAESVAGAIVKL